MIETKFDRDRKSSFALDGDVVVGKCQYVEVGNSWNIVHTEVSSLYQGQEITKKLVE